MKLFLTGKTGSGKTYRAINEFSVDTKFVYIAPCRQLVYESFIEYSTNKDSICTGEIKLIKDGNLFAVYESVSVDLMKNYETLIIDEAHFLTDEQRGAHLYELLMFCCETNKNIILLTATDNIERLDDFVYLHLDSVNVVPEKIKVNFETFEKNIKDGLQTIIFCNSISDTYNIAEYYKNKGYNAEAINSAITPDERLKIQYDFKREKIQIICATNVLAQGLNFPCSNLLISNDMWSDESTYIQKLGRLGRPFLSKSTEVYYCTDVDIKNKLSKKKVITEKNKYNQVFSINISDGNYIYNHRYITVANGEIVDTNFFNHQMINFDSLYYNFDYSDIKYAKEYIIFCKNIGVVNNKIEIACNIFVEMETKIKEVIDYLKSKQSV